MRKLYAEFRADVRYAFRTLRMTPGFTAVAVLTLGLGLGASTAVFSVVNAVLLNPLPYANPDRLVQIVEHVPAEESFGGQAQRRTAMNMDEFDTWRAQSQTLSHLAMIVPGGRTLVTEERTAQLYGASVSPALFAMRGIVPILGRGLVAADERPDADAIVLGEAAWREQFRSDPNIISRILTLDGRVFTVVGVMPTEFGTEAFWTPLFVPPSQPGQVRLASATARIRDGISLETASAEINTIGLRLRGITAERGITPRFELVREIDQITARVAPTLRVLVVAVAAVLLIVCTNVANLLLVRGTQRQHEIAIRRALGATRSRIIRLALAESLTLTAIAGIFAIGLAVAAVQLVKSAAIVNLPRRFSGGAAILPRAEEISFDPPVLAFVVVVVVIVSAVFGILPALRLSGFGQRGHSAAARLSPPASTARVSQALATAQVGLAMALLIGAGLMLNSFLRLAAVDPGFDARGVLTFELVLPGYATAERKLEVADELVARVQDHPRVIAAGFTDIPPLAGNIFSIAALTPEDMTEAEMREAESALPPPTQARLASPGYLRALGARLVDGTWIEEQPRRTAYTVLVSRAYAERYFPGRSAVGAVLRDAGRNVTIVGVVDHIHLSTLEGASERIVFIDPGQQLAAQRAAQPQRLPQIDRTFLTIGGSAITFAVRVDGNPLAVIADLRSVVRDIDATIAIDSVIPMETVLSGITTRPRFYALLLSTFGAVAGFIAAIGIYGVLAYLVSQRTKEIGIRMALGAQQVSVLKLILWHAFPIITVGITAGVLGALGVTRYLEGLLYGITSLDVATYVVVAVAFTVVAAFASYVPARRATHVDPLVALRHE